MPQSKPRKSKARREKKRQIQGGEYRPQALARPETKPETKQPPLRVKEPPLKKESKVEDASYTLPELKKIGIITGALMFALVMASLVL
jgi:hypothetical protein